MRLCCFIIFIDYIMLDMLHHVIINTMEELLWILEQHIPFVPSEEALNDLSLINIDIQRPDVSYQVKILYLDI